ncbi:MAG: hypothetical protein IT318_24025 [Anaerolineales bacterium]|nr:hypothetical protein [Anaerolineales bacterium]
MLATDNPPPREFDPPLDAGIERAVILLCAAGIETFESCEGGAGHCYLQPTVRFSGDRSEGFRALALALQNALPVRAIQRVWTIDDGEPTGPYWEITFWQKLEPDPCLVP